MIYRTVKITKKLFNELKFLGKWASPARTVSEQINWLLNNFQNKENKHCGTDPLRNNITLDNLENMNIDELLADINNSAPKL